MDILDWNRAKECIVKLLAENPHVLKIVLKTKDQPELLAHWIEHHAMIVGHENLIIFDNGSSSPDVEQIYQRHSHVVPIIRYDGAVDNLHHVRLFSELYKALRTSCAYYIFLDTDERLIWVDGERYWADQRIVDCIARHRQVSIFPGTWLRNVIRHQDQYELDPRKNHLREGLRWGKPIISANVDVDGFINHNCQLPGSSFGSEIVTGCFVLHLSRLSPEQRINANLLKLISLKKVPTEADLAWVLARNIDEFHDVNAREFVREIQELAQTPPGHTAPHGLCEGVVQFQEDGALKFFDEAQRNALAGFLENPRRAAAEAGITRSGRSFTVGLGHARSGSQPGSAKSRSRPE